MLVHMSQLLFLCVPLQAKERERTVQKQQEEEEEEEEEGSGSVVVSSPPTTPTGFSDQNKKWLKPAGKKTKNKEKRKAGHSLSQKTDLPNGSGGDSDHESGERQPNEVLMSSQNLWVTIK